MGKVKKDGSSLEESEQTFSLQTLELDSSAEVEQIPVQINGPENKIYKRETKVVKEDEPLINCLRKDKIIVRHIPRESGMVTNPKHILYGGMGENAVVAYTVPILENSKTPVNVLTNNEKNFLEVFTGMEPNALSVYLKDNNFWDNFQVKLTKGDNFLDLSDPLDYIKYKVLLANRDFIAPSLSVLADSPKVTYKFVIISENEEVSQASKSMSATMEAYFLFGGIKNEKNLLKIIIKIIDGKPVSDSAKLEWLQIQAEKLIKANAKLFCKVVKDPFLRTRVLIEDAISCRIIKRQGDFYYLSSDNAPLCSANEDPTLSKAVEYLNLPRNQELKLTIEAKLKSLSE